MRHRTHHLRRIGFLCAAFGLLFALPASAQKERIRTYQKELENQIGQELEEYRLAQVEAKEQEIAEETARRRTPAVARPGADTHPDIQELRKELQELQRPFKYVVNVHESNDGEGQDVEIRLTMPLDEFMEFAPIAALEAAAVTHKFPVVHIYIREETTDRVARVAFKDAEPIAARYLGGDEDAVDEMNDILIWH